MYKFEKDIVISSFRDRYKKLYQGENEINKLGILLYFTGAHTIYTRKTHN